MHAPLNFHFVSYSVTHLLKHVHFNWTATHKTETFHRIQGSGTIRKFRRTIFKTRRFKNPANRRFSPVDLSLVCRSLSSNYFSGRYFHPYCHLSEASSQNQHGTSILLLASFHSLSSYPAFPYELPQTKQNSWITYLATSHVCITRKENIIDIQRFPNFNYTFIWIEFDIRLKK